MLELFDAQAGFGGAKPGQTWIPSADELLGHMKRLSVARALVRTDFEDMDAAVPISNRILYETCKAHKSLVPCPTMIPSAGGDIAPEEEQIDEAVANGSGAVTIRPNQDTWSLAPWCSGPLMEALEARRLPVLCRQASFTFEAIADLAERYPKLPIVMFQAGYRFQRTLVPLMQTFKNVHLAMGSPFSVHRGVEFMVQNVGAKQLLFGTGFPTSDMMPGITMLTYSEISESDKKLIGSANLDRLIKGIKK